MCPGRCRIGLCHPLGAQNSVGQGAGGRSLQLGQPHPCSCGALHLCQLVPGGGGHLGVFSPSKAALAMREATLAADLYKLL